MRDFTRDHELESWQRISGGRTMFHSRSAREVPTYRLRLEFLEGRLAPGDALLGALLGSALITARSLDDSSDWNKEFDEFHKPGSIAPFFGEPQTQPLAVVSVSFADAALGAARAQVTVSQSDHDTAAETAGVVTPAWVTLPSIASSTARLMPRGLGGAAGDRGQTAGASFVGTQIADHRLAVSLGVLSQTHSVGTRGALTQSFSPAAGASRTAKSSTPANDSLIRQNYSNLALSFEANVGQADPSVHFLAHGPGYGLYLTGTEAVIVLNPGSGARGQGSAVRAQRSGIGSPRSGIEDPMGVLARSGNEGLSSLTPDSRPLTPASVVHMQTLGGNPMPRLVGEDPLPGKINYFLGNDPTQWHTNVATFAKVEYQDVYPGINLVYYAHQGELEYDFVVAPGADPRAIHLGFTGPDRVAVDDHGGLVVHAGGQEIVQHKPVVYQKVNGTRQEIASSFVVSTNPSGLTTPQVGFELGTYNQSRPLVIDPVLSYSTYLGGSGSDYGYGSIAVDPVTGDALVTGNTTSADFPTANPFQSNYGGGNRLFGDAFVSRLTADGSALVYSTYLGGSDQDVGTSIAVDAGTGDALVTGWTSSTDFPTANALQPNLRGFVANAFVARLTADGSALVYSTYLGGSSSGDGDAGNGIAVDPSTGDALVTGSTDSPDFPTANALQPNLRGVEDAFVARLTADGSALVYSTYLGGSGGDEGNAIAVDPSTGDALVTGDTGTDFPTANALQPVFGGGRSDAFVARLTADGSALVYSTYLGGSGDDIGEGIAVDPATGDALVTGYTFSTNFPTANALQPTNHGPVNAFVARLSADGGTLVYSTYLGGSGGHIGFSVGDYGRGIAVDPSTGDALVTGYTFSTDFPTANALQPNLRGFDNAFVARLTADGGALVYSTYLGGSAYDYGQDIALDPSTGDALVTGFTSSTDFPTANALQPCLRGSSNAFVARISF
jgi:hypothetical protein